MAAAARSRARKRRPKWAGTCEACGAPLVGRKRRYCDRACDNRARASTQRLRRIVRCHECGVDLHGGDRHPGRHYCPAHKLEDRTCAACGAVFRWKRGHRKKTCSPECAAKSQAVNRSHAQAATSSCEWCGKTIATTAARITRGRSRFCCRSHATFYGNWQQHGLLSTELIWVDGIARAVDMRDVYIGQARLLGTATPAEKRHKQAEYGGRCAYGCGRKAATWDHIIPVSRGGSDAIDNQVPACLHCNSQKGARSLAEWHPIHAAGQLALGLV